MRIIAGTARGRKIFSVSKNLPVKPISDRIKQSVFDIIRPRVPGAIMLDLRVNKLAKGLVNYSVKLKKGEMELEIKSTDLEFIREQLLKWQNEVVS